MFPDDAAAEKWFEHQRWSVTGRHCPSCGSLDTYETKRRKPMPYRCRDCGEYFSVKKGSVMESSRLGYQKWAIAMYMMVTGIQGGFVLHGFLNPPNEITAGLDIPPAL